MAEGFVTLGKSSENLEEEREKSKGRRGERGTEEPTESHMAGLEGNTCYNGKEGKNTDKAATLDPEQRTIMMGEEATMESPLSSSTQLIMRGEQHDQAGNPPF
jgi:hypothetical protein